MPQLVFIDSQDQAHAVPFSPDQTLLQVAQKAVITGILAECGGGCSCATCHVMLDPAWQGTVAPPSAQETDMLTFAVDPSPHSRLACQVVLTEAHDGLTVTVAKRQF